MPYFLMVMIGAVVIGIAALNLWYYRYVSTLTSEERAAHLEEIGAERKVW